MNVVLLIGNMTQDPELRYIAAGHAMATFTVAVDRDHPSAGGDETNFIQVVCWRTLAEQVGQYAKRGRLVGVQGRLQARTYEAADGSRRRITEVVASQVRLLNGPKIRQEQESGRPQDAPA